MKTQITLVTILTFLLFLLIKCEELLIDEPISSNDVEFSAVVIGKGMDCGDIFLIKLTGDTSKLYSVTNSNDSVYYADSLPENLKIEGAELKVKLRSPDEHEIRPCTNMGVTYNHVIITDACFAENYNSIHYIDKKTGGCFNGNQEDKKSYPNSADTLFYEINNDTLNLHIGLNYNCCGLLSDSISIEHNRISIFIADTCTGYYCECRCICYFTYTYQFLLDEGSNISLEVLLNSFRESEYTLIMQGDV